MRILFLSRWYPNPPDNGSKIRILNLLRSLCEQHSVSLISFKAPGEHISIQNFPVPGPVEIKICPYFEFNPQSPGALLGYFSRDPRSIVDTYSPEMESLIREAVNKNRFDLIIASQTSMASYYQCFDGIPAIFEELELGCYYPDGSKRHSIFERTKAKLGWEKHRRYISRLLPHFKSCTVASEIERRLAAEAAPGYKSIHLIPNTIDLGLYEAPAGEHRKNSLIFTGSLRYSANYEAVNWFLKDIYPSIRSDVKDISLIITGDTGDKCLSLPHGVTLTGRVQNVRELVRGSTVSIAPILNGGGTRLKILEAFASGTPVVATSKAAEGLDAKDEEHFLCADTPKEFARAVLCLLRQPEVAERMAERALTLVNSQYDWRNLSHIFLGLVQQAVQP